jgi:hypothetical protein
LVKLLVLDLSALAFWLVPLDGSCCAVPKEFDERNPVQAVNEKARHAKMPETYRWFGIVFSFRKFEEISPR